MDVFPRPDYVDLRRYLPDASPVEVDLSDNRNLWGAHPAALEALAAAGSDQASRYPESYAERLARAVADAWSIDPARVATGVGATGVLDAAMRAVAPTTVRCMDPGWPAAAMLARMNGHSVEGVEWSAALDDPVAFVGSEPCIVFVANPGNPTGEAAPDAWIRAVWERVERLGGVFLLDEAYGEYLRDAEDRTAVDLALAGERTLLVKTLSKAYGLAGLRVGYGVGSASLALEADKARGPFAVSGVAVAAAARALESDSPWLADTVARTRRIRDRATLRLRSRGCPVPSSEANFVFVPLDEDEVESAARGLEALGVRTRPFAGRGARGSGLRATVGPEESMERLLDALERTGTAGGRVASS